MSVFIKWRCSKYCLFKYPAILITTNTVKNPREVHDHNHFADQNGKMYFNIYNNIDFTYYILT